MRANSASSFGSSSSFKLDDDGTKSPLEDHEDLEDYKNNLIRYGKSFSTKLIQVLVQSRTADHFTQSCTGSVESPLHWFNLHLDELGEVTAFIKSLKITNFPPAVPQLSIDFFLYTCDHETLPLETWSFVVEENDRKNCSPQCPINAHRSAFYHQLSTLLRSAMVAARMTPLHRYYVKKQSAETFVVLYRVVNGPSTIDIGRDAQKVRLGNLSSYMGSWKLDLAYRTRMEIEPTSSHVIDGADSFQRIGSPGSTPESFKMQIGSPSSFGGISHFSTSPSTSSPIEFSPIQDNIIQSRMQVSNSTPTVKTTRSRSTSLASDSEDIASEHLNEMRRSVTIPKNMPFANLLILSYSGTLFPLMEGTNEQEDDNATVLNTSNTTVVAKSSQLDDEMENSLEDRSRKNTIVEMKRPTDLNLASLNTPKKRGEDGTKDTVSPKQQTNKNEIEAVEKEGESDSEEPEETCSTPKLNAQSDEDLTPKEAEVSSSVSEVNNAPNEEKVGSTTPTPSAVVLHLRNELSPENATQDVLFKMGSSSCLKNSTEGEEHGNALAGNKKRVTVKLEPEHFEKEEQSAETSGEEADDDSFVKIPPFHMQFNRDNDDNLASLLVDCKEPPSLSSFEPVDFSQIQEELDNLSLNQGLFDQFISEIREGTMDESP